MNRHQGLTILELLVVLAIGGILATLALPSMLSTLYGNRLTTEVNQLSGLLSYARKEAVSRRTTVSSCATNNGTQCNTTQWEKGILIFIGDAQSTTTPNSNDTLKIIAAFNSSNSIRRKSNTSSVPSDFNAGYLRYTSSGMVESSDASNIIFCDSRGSSKGRALIINGVGQIRPAFDTDNDGEVEVILDGSAKALSDVGCT